MKKKNKAPATKIEFGVELKRCATCKDAAKPNTNGEKKNYICIEGSHIPMSDMVLAAFKRMLQPGVKLYKIPEGETFKIGDYEFVVLRHCIDGTAVILKDLLPDDMTFRENNNYDGSKPDKACQEFAQALASIIGWDNILLHQVDLTSNDGLKDYGVIERRASLLTAEQYRRYVHILDQYKPDRWWWLATPDSTATHECENWVLCVSPRGVIYNNRCSNGDRGVRPFCILNSNIFVSK